MSIIAGLTIPDSGQVFLDEQVYDHFGKAPTFTILNQETGGLTIVDNTSDHMGGTVSPPELIRSIGADTLAVGHLGAKAADRCAELGITVMCGARGSVREVMDQLREGRLSPPGPETMCHHH
jgi:predicted Fe-Mo cluster-binding NifX family protein